MKKNVDPRLIQWIAGNWNDRNRADEVQEVIEAIVAELKQDYREWQRHNRLTPEAEAYWEGLISDVQNEDFWDKMDHLLQFNFDF